MINKELIINAFFQDETFEQTWMEMKSEYETLGFKDELSDSQMIEEFIYISQQLRKYKFSKQDQIINHDTLEEIIKEIEGLIGSAAEYPPREETDNGYVYYERKKVVYNFMRDHWLINMYNALTMVLNAETEDEEDEDA